MASVYERITSALSSLGKRRDRDSDANESSGLAGASPGGRTSKRFRPWEQADLHHRLESYKQLTWFGKPASVGPIPCALRGWTNTGPDTLCCEYCNAKLVYPPQVSHEQRQAAADMFTPHLTSKHAASCPWRQTACNQSLLAYVPSTSNDELCALFNSLQNKLLRVDVLPDLDAIAIRAVRDAAAQYGPYDDLVLGGGAAAAGALTPRRPPSVRIFDGSDGAAGGAAAAAAAAAEASGSAAAADDPASSATFIVQPSKLSPAQKARLLALLGWDMDVLQLDSASAVAAAPYTQAAGYSLQHLGVRAKKPTATTSSSPAAAAAAGAAAGGGSADGGRFPMSSVVLKCRHCSGRMGLWNFAGVRPVPSGRLTPAQQPTGAASLLSPRAAAASGGGAAVAVAAAAAPAPADPLSGTIAGGQYGLHGAGGPRPFGSASAAPFRFGSSAAAEPVFGIAAMDASIARRPAGSLGGGGAASTSAPAPFGGLFGSPPPAARPPLAPLSTSLARTPLAATAAGGSAAAGAQPSGSLTGHKRKAGEEAGAEPMAVDAEAGHDGKRQRMASATPPPPGRTPTSALRPGGGTQPKELDPVGQHHSWCPWIYTGTSEQPHMSGWQHMLSALAAQQQQQRQAAEAAEAGVDGAQSPSGRDARQLRDAALAATRAL